MPEFRFHRLRRIYRVRDLLNQERAETGAHPMNGRGDGCHRHAQLSGRLVVGDRALILQQEALQNLEPLCVFLIFYFKVRYEVF